MALRAVLRKRFRVTRPMCTATQRREIDHFGAVAKCLAAILFSDIGKIAPDIDALGFIIYECLQHRLSSNGSRGAGSHFSRAQYHKYTYRLL